MFSFVNTMLLSCQAAHVRVDGDTFLPNLCWLMTSIWTNTLCPASAQMTCLIVRLFHEPNPNLMWPSTGNLCISNTCSTLRARAHLLTSSIDSLITRPIKLFSPTYQVPLVMPVPRSTNQIRHIDHHWQVVTMITRLRPMPWRQHYLSQSWGGHCVH